MANIFDYLAWRKDVPFSVSPFNEVDSLVLSELVYADFGGVVPEEGEPVPLEEARKRFWQRHTREEIMAQDSFTKTAPFLMDGMVDGARYANTELRWFYDVVDDGRDLQLAALSFYLPDGTVFVAFRGTDSHIVGWKEDFNLSYMPETEGQRRSAAYMNRHFTDCSLSLRLGGHSKGGNMAVFAAVHADPAVRKRITAVYSNDGPGFLEDFTQSDAYREMLPRIVSIVPEDSIIGTLLYSGACEHVVKSSAFGILQHDGFTWQVLGPKFVDVEKRSEVSVLTETTLAEWLGSLSEENRKGFVNNLFGLFEATGAETFDDIRQNMVGSLVKMKKMMDTMDREQREILWEALMQLLKMSCDNMLQETRKAVLSKLNGIGALWGQYQQKEQQHLPGEA